MRLGEISKGKTNLQTRSKSDWLTARKCGAKKIIIIDTRAKLNLAKIATDYALMGVRNWMGDKLRISCRVN